MSEKRYELTKEEFELESFGVTLYRIRALRSFDVGSITVEQGELGGWVESEKNLSQDGTAWVFHEAKVYGNAVVRDAATVFNDAEVWGDAVVEDEATVAEQSNVGGKVVIAGNAVVEGRASVFGQAVVKGSARVVDEATVTGNAVVQDSVSVVGHACVYGSAVLKGFAVLLEDCRVFGEARVEEYAQVGGSSSVSENAVVSGHASVFGLAVLAGSVTVGGRVRVDSSTRLVDGCLTEEGQYVTVGPAELDRRFVTFNITSGTVATEGFSGTLTEFESWTASRQDGTHDFVKNYNRFITLFQSYGE